MSFQSSHLFPAELAQMNQLMFGFMTSQAIAVAAKLGIADLLKEEPRTAEELATAKQAHAASLNRLLRMLTSVAFSRKMQTADSSRRRSASSYAATVPDRLEV